MTIKCLSFNVHTNKLIANVLELQMKHATVSYTEHMLSYNKLHQKNDYIHVICQAAFNATHHVFINVISSDE